MIPFAAFLYYVGPTLLAGLFAAVFAVQSHSAWKAFLVCLVGTVVLAMALGAGLNSFPILGPPWPGRWLMLDLGPSVIFGLILGIISAVWIGGRAPPSIRQ